MNFLLFRALGSSVRSIPFNLTPPLTLSACLIGVLLDREGCPRDLCTTPKLPGWQPPRETAAVRTDSHPRVVAIGLDFSRRRGVGR